MKPDFSNSDGFRPCHAARRMAAGHGFTLIELLTVVAIIGVVAGILIVVAGGVREKVRTAQCVGNLRQLGIALLAYSNDRPARNLPAAYINDGRWIWVGNNASGYPVNYGHLQYEGYLGGAPRTNIRGPARSRVFNCPSYSDPLLWDSSSGQGYGEYFYTAGHVYYNNLRDKNGPGVGVPIYEVDPNQAIITDFAPQSMDSARHDGGSSINALYIDGSVQNIKRKDFLTNNRLTAFNKRRN